MADPLLQQAQLEAQVRYNPQLRALGALISNLGSQYNQTVLSQRGAAQMMQAAADHAMPVINQVYDRADQARGQGLGDVQGQYAKLGPAADIFRAALARENQNAGNMSQGQRADALAELQRRKVGASEGALFATQNAARQYLAQVLQIGQQMAGLQGDEGTFTAATLQSLKDAQAGRLVTMRGQDLSHQDRQAQLGINQQNANTRASGGGRGGGVNTTKQAAALSGINKARTFIGQLQGAGLPEPTIRQLLIAGHRTKGGTTIPAFPADYVEAAYELKGWGVLTPHTAQTLQSNYGVDPNRLASALGARIGQPGPNLGRFPVL